MIYMNCPSCGAHGRIPEDRVNTPIVCKKCLKTFHVKPSGHAVAGGPPIEGKAHGQPHEFDHRQDFDQWLEKFNNTVHKLIPIATVLAVGLAVAIGFTWSQPALEDQVATMATALARGDKDAIRGLAVEGTGDAAVEWLGRIHPVVKDAILASPTVVPLVTVIAKQKDPRIGGVAVRARISPEVIVGRRAVAESAPDSAAAMARSIDVPLILESSIWKGWRLDGDRTLKAFQKQAEALRVDSDAP